MTEKTKEGLVTALAFFGVALWLGGAWVYNNTVSAGFPENLWAKLMLSGMGILLFLWVIKNN